ncbi:M56 family metallopeptidase [Roseivirga sp.]|uniref:M56 family metallopeptidase n=1 Tax=Roseivirga sp. TaxID=1964215 RepID=UPI003B8B4A62
MTSYLIEASICLGCFYTFYWLFLKSEKLLSINRVYLISTSVLALCIPLMSFEMPLGLFNSIEAIATQPAIGTATNTPSSSAVNTGISLNTIYIIGLIVASIILIFKVAALKKRLGAKFSFKSRNVNISPTDGFNAYSFFNTIYIGDELCDNENLKSHVIAHELAHIKGKHSLDIFFFEIVKCVFWFNPFSYFYLKSIKIQHEYIADDHALKLSSAKNYEKSLLELTLSKLNVALVSSFSEHPIEKRLKMIQKLNSNVMKKFKPLFVLPVIGLLVIGIACTPEPDAEPATIPGADSSIEPDVELITEESTAVYDSVRILLGEDKKPVLFQGVLFEGDEKSTTTIDILEENSGVISFEADVVVIESENEWTETANNEIAEVPISVKGVRSEFIHERPKAITELKTNANAVYEEKPFKVATVTGVKIAERKKKN